MSLLLTMPSGWFLASLLFAATCCIGSLFYGVYRDHVDRQRTRRSNSTRHTCEQRHHERREALEVTGGACADGKPGLR